MLTNDSVALTTFAQTVAIFRDLVKDLTGNRITLIDVNMRNPPIAHAIDRVLIPVFNL